MSGARNRHADYHARKALGGSTVAKIATKSLRDALVPFGGSDAAAIGSCVDAMWTEGLAASQVFAAPPVVNRRTKDGKAAWSAYELNARRAGLYTFDRTPNECISRVRYAYDALCNHRRAERMRSTSKAQEPLFWTEETPHGPIACKGLVDLLPEVDGSFDLVDLKTTTSELDARSVRNLVLSRGYDFQLAHYRRGLIANGITPDACFLIFAQTVEPFGVEVYEIAEQDIDAADHALEAEHYPRFAAWKHGAESYTGHGYANGGMEPAHLLNINR